MFQNSTYQARITYAEAAEAAVWIFLFIHSYYISEAFLKNFFNVMFLLLVKRFMNNLVRVKSK